MQQNANTKPAVKVETVDFPDIKRSELVTLTKMGNVIELQHMAKRNNKPTILKLNKDQYLTLSTGEVKEYQHTENRSESKKELKSTFKRLRYYINNNFFGKKNELFLTLTYAENMQDTVKLQNDLEKFVKKLRYKFSDKCKKAWGHSSIDYITVVEPHESGDWHCHVLLRFNDLKSVYLNNDEQVNPLWGQGWTKTRRVNEKQVDNIGAYLTAYLTDIELNDKTVNDITKAYAGKKMDIREKEVDGVQKKFVKGGRLHFYPVGMRIFRRSNGIKYPERETMSYADAKKVVGTYKPHYSKSYKITDDNGFSNQVSFAEYNQQRAIKNLSPVCYSTNVTQKPQKENKISPSLSM